MSMPLNLESRSMETRMASGSPSAAMDFILVSAQPPLPRDRQAAQPVTSVHFVEDKLANHSA